MQCNILAGNVSDVKSKKTNKKDAKMKQTMGEIVEELMRKVGFERSYSRGSDSLDFRDCSVIAIKCALEDAFRAGKESNK